VTHLKVGIQCFLFSVGLNGKLSCWGSKVRAPNETSNDKIYLIFCLEQKSSNAKTVLGYRDPAGTQAIHIYHISANLPLASFCFIYNFLRHVVILFIPWQFCRSNFVWNSGRELWIWNNIRGIFCPLLPCHVSQHCWGDLPN